MSAKRAIRLLVVDDESEIREMLARHLRYTGYEVLLAASGHAALEILEKSRIDVVISDIMMPEMDGVSLLRCIRSDYPMTRVVMITGFVTQENVLACMRMGAETCLFKPLEDLELLDSAVQRAVKHMIHWIDILNELRGLEPSASANRRLDQ